MRTPSEVILRSASDMVPSRAGAKPWILAATILGSSMAFIDGTVVNVALPALQANFHTSVVGVQWVVESYGLILGALILVGGSLGDLFGRRLIFVTGVATFAVASGFCGIATNISELIIARSIQGAGAALLVPGSLAMVERRKTSPMVPPMLFKAPGFSGANLLTLFLYSAIGVFFFLFPLNLIQVQGYSSTATGAAMLPLIVLMFFLSRWSGGLVARYGARGRLILGSLIIVVGFVLFVAPAIASNYWTSFFPAVLVLGLGMAVTVAPLTTAVMNSADQDQVGAASGINNAVARVAGVLAIAVLGIVLVGAFRSRLETALAGLSLSPSALQELRAQEIKLAGLQVPADIDPATGAAIKRMVGEAFVFAFRLIMFVCAGLSLASAAVARIMIPNHRLRQAR